MADHETLKSTRPSWTFEPWPKWLIINFKIPSAISVQCNLTQDFQLITSKILDQENEKLNGELVIKTQVAEFTGTTMVLMTEIYDFCDPGLC